MYNSQAPRKRGGWFCGGGGGGRQGPPLCLFVSWPRCEPDDPPPRGGGGLWGGGGGGGGGAKATLLDLSKSVAELVWSLSRLLRQLSRPSKSRGLVFRGVGGRGLRIDTCTYGAACTKRFVGRVQEAMVGSDWVSCPVFPPPLLCARTGIRGFLVSPRRPRGADLGVEGGGPAP